MDDLVVRFKHARRAYPELRTMAMGVVPRRAVAELNAAFRRTADGSVVESEVMARFVKQVDELRSAIWDDLFEQNAFRVRRTEFLMGDEVTKEPRDRFHRRAVEIVHDILRSAAAEKGADVRRDFAFARVDDSEPVPDVSVYYVGNELPTLVVDVTREPSCQVLRGRVYARAGVATWWLFDLSKRELDIYRGPTADGFDVRVTLSGSDTLEVLGIRRVRVDRMFRTGERRRQLERR